MSTRFQVIQYDDEYGWHFVLIDTETGEEVGTDGGEPEDQLLVRDWKWVPELLNKLDDELKAAEKLLNKNIGCPCGLV